jgi:predicted DNA-binding ribbon-helix-helix protein
MRFAGHRTSIALEPAFWSALEAIAAARRQSLPALIAAIDKDRAASKPHATLASAARVFALTHAPSGLTDVSR